MTYHTYRIYVQGDKLEYSQWDKFFETISGYGKNFTLEIHIEENEISFYLLHKKNLSQLSSKIFPFLLKPENLELDIEGKRFVRNLRFINNGIPRNKNILEIKEDEEIKRNRILKKVVWKFNSLFKIDFSKIEFYFEKEDKIFTINKYFFKKPYSLLEINFSQLIKYKKKSFPLYLKIENVSELFTADKSKGFMDIIGFPYIIDPRYLDLKNFEFNKHSLIVGQTGVGKSKFIELFVKELRKRNLQNEYAVIIIDPHAKLYSGFSNLSGSTEINFKNNLCDLFPQSSDPKIATELTILLFKTLLKDQFNAKIERVLKYTLFTLFLTQEMSFTSLRKFLTELEYRKSILVNINHLENLSHFFDTEFIEMQTKFYEIAIMPILVLIDELSFLPVFSQEKPNSLVDLVKNNFLTCLSLDKIFLGDKATKLIAGLIIQQIFLLAQNRLFTKKIILIIDEISIVENDALVPILAEARKFDLSLFLSQQYLTQVQPDLLKSVLSNVYNYFVFKVAEEDAKVLGKNLQMDFPDEILKSTKDKGGDEESLRVKLMNSLNPRECLVRIFSREKFYQCFKAKTFDI